jgi:hypothetical protein
VVVLGWLAVNISLQSLIQPPLPETAAYRQQFNLWAKMLVQSLYASSLYAADELPSLRHQRLCCNIPAVYVEYKACQTISRLHCQDSIPKILTNIDRIETARFSHNSYIHDLYIPTVVLPIVLQENRWTNRGNILIAHRYMNVCKLGLRPCSFFPGSTDIGFSLQCVREPARDGGFKHVKKSMLYNVHSFNF